MKLKAKLAGLLILIFIYLVFMAFAVKTDWATLAVVVCTMLSLTVLVPLLTYIIDLLHNILSCLHEIINLLIAEDNLEKEENNLQISKENK